MLSHFHQNPQKNATLTFSMLWANLIPKCFFLCQVNFDARIIHKHQSMYLRSYSKVISCVLVISTEVHTFLNNRCTLQWRISTCNNPVSYSDPLTSHFLFTFPCYCHGVKFENNMGRCQCREDHALELYSSLQQQHKM